VAGAADGAGCRMRRRAGCGDARDARATTPPPDADSGEQRECDWRVGTATARRRRVALTLPRPHVGAVQSMLPLKTLPYVERGRNFCERFETVTILFSDIVSFTSMAATMDPLRVVNMLNELYRMYDGLVDKHHVYKVETIGDAFMCAGGVRAHPADARGLWAARSTAARCGSEGIPLNSAFLDALISSGYAVCSPAHLTVEYLEMTQHASLLKPTCCTAWASGRAGCGNPASVTLIGVTRGINVTLQTVTTRCMGRNSQNPGQARVATHSGSCTNSLDPHTGSSKFGISVRCPTP
jgi:hypothetical protein